ncbi:MAG: hypothetical protein FWG98_15495 [Candidatus Cloacimonetes bacterium]|nr:hypothetical protein [Candidatus Cloacimonadota bacterium]
MKTTLLYFFLIVCFTNFLFSDVEFCDHTVLVVLESSLSGYSRSLVDESFFGDFEKVSIENIFQIHNENAINALNEKAERNGKNDFRSIYKITLLYKDKAKVLIGQK